MKIPNLVVYLLIVFYFIQTMIVGAFCCLIFFPQLGLNYQITQRVIYQELTIVRKDIYIVPAIPDRQEKRDRLNA